MEKNIASTRITKDPRARQLIDLLDQASSRTEITDGVIYYEYPLFQDLEGGIHRCRVLVAARSHGLLLFGIGDLDDKSATPLEIESTIDDLAQLHSQIFSKLIRSKVLRRSPQDTCVSLSTILYLPDVSPHSMTIDLSSGLKVVHSRADLESLLPTLRQQSGLRDDQWAELRSVIEGAKGLAYARRRRPSDSPTGGRASILRDLEMEISNFDADQRKAALAIVDGPQRIRGLAGSGKTIVLAMKAAHLHLDDPNRLILLTFYTKSLYDILKRLVTRFYRHFNDRDPDWEQLHILHAWGGRSVPGVYYNACVDNGVAPLRFQDAPHSSEGPFESVCLSLLQSRSPRAKYDHILIDEAQDMPPSFFRLCFQLTKGGDLDRNVVWAYDDLQTITNVQVRPPRELFGVNAANEPLMDLDRAAERSGLAAHNIVLKRCYRNPREILVVSHALGFGIYSDTIVQMLEDRSHWEDLGYVVERGNCKPGETTTIFRPEENSPLSLSSRQSAAELIECRVADSLVAECEWVAGLVVQFLSEGIRPEEIVIISLDDRNAKAYFRQLSALLTTRGVQVQNVLADPFSQSTFAVDGHVTLSTVYRAKGNEAPVAIAVGLDALYPVRELQSGRNKLFTAFSRARAWLRVSGIGPAAASFAREIEEAIRHLPRMTFTYPDPSSIPLIQRDRTDKASALQRAWEQLEDLMSKFELADDEKKAIVEGFLRKK